MGKIMRSNQIDKVVEKLAGLMGITPGRVLNYDAAQDISYPEFVDKNHDNYLTYLKTNSMENPNNKILAGLSCGALGVGLGSGMAYLTKTPILPSAAILGTSGSLLMLMAQEIDAGRIDEAKRILKSSSIDQEVRDALLKELILHQNSEDPNIRLKQKIIKFLS